MKFISIKKKLRGTRRIVRKLPTWGERYKYLDISNLRMYGKEYVKVWINPFYNLHQYSQNKVGKRNPSYKLQKLIFFQLIEIYLSWEKQLASSNEPYYLKLWIGDPEFIDSQLVAAIGTEIAHYTQLFSKHDKPKVFPYSNIHPSFHLFTWERCVNGYYVWESDLEIEEIPMYRKKAYSIDEYEINGNKEISYFISTGDMWIGAIRRSGNFT
ncbi:hypothetical protein [Paenibacillus sp. IITD108]|uniref:hypothetical protein n=1 Tax=Paenibacillus sp. IITD108 TaxID=3116649 RepID=UPI002F3ED18C